MPLYRDVDIMLAHEEEPTEEVPLLEAPTPSEVELPEPELPVS